MPLPLPKVSDCKPSDAARVRSLLDSVIAFRTTAKTTYQFYEEIDAWLGPWGLSGYPIGYGKKYNLLFSSNPPLNRDLNYGKPWVEKTTVYLQEAIRDYIVSRVSAGSIAAMTEADLRAAAFDSHPSAYLRGGLLAVVENSPELFLVIMTIPIEEFSPTSPNFKATIQQVMKVISLSKIPDLLKASMGLMVRSSSMTLIVRLIWQAAAGRMKGVPPLPKGAADDSAADMLGFVGGLFNMFER
jgi:hypothetical protein